MFGGESRLVQISDGKSKIKGGWARRRRDGKLSEIPQRGHCLFGKFVVCATGQRPPAVPAGPRERLVLRGPVSRLNLLGTLP